MKLVFTKNELVTMVKTTMTIPGLMKKFLTDDYIIKTFEEKILELNKKTTAVVYSKVNDEYTIEVTEMFTLEMISEFGSLINAMITLTIGVGARMKMIADKYKVKEDDLSKKPKSDVEDPIKPDNKDGTIRFYDLDKSMVSNSILIKKHTICINDYDTLKTRLIRGSAQIDGLIFHNGTIYEIRPLSGGIDMAIYLVTKDNYISAGNIYRVIDTNVTSDDIIYNYEVQIDSHDDTSDMWILFFNNLDNMHLFLDKNFKL